MAKMRVLIIDGFGINCARETKAAYTQLGLLADIVHLSQLFEEKVNLLNYRILNFPGGFSYGDDLGAGRVLASLIKYKKLPSGKTFFSKLLNYIDNGGYIIGICNGFQVLLALGLLPGLCENHTQEAALVVNESAKFEDRWVRCKTPENSLAAGLLPQGIAEYPVRHKEGRIIIKDKALEKEILDKGLIALQYCNKNGELASAYPENPNNSWLGTAGLIHPNKRILGLMPHPEAAFSIYNHPDWDKGEREETERKGDGYWFFKKIIESIK